LKPSALLSIIQGYCDQLASKQRYETLSGVEPKLNSQSHQVRAETRMFSLNFVIIIIIIIIWLCFEFITLVHKKSQSTKYT